MLDPSGYDAGKKVKGRKRAREKLGEERRRDPGNKYVLNNIQLLEDSYRTGNAIE